jgi:hypothetical protein
LAPNLAYVEQSKRLVFRKCPDMMPSPSTNNFVVQAVDVFVSAGRDKAATFSIPA